MFLKGPPWSGWETQKPSTVQERSEMWSRCKNKHTGKNKCFIGTSKKSFPVCVRRTCRTSKKGLWSAYVRAQGLFHKTGRRKYRTVAIRAYKQLGRGTNISTKTIKRKNKK